MGFIVSIFAWLFTKGLGLFGGGLISLINTKMTQETARQGIWASTLAAAISADAERYKAASQERVALWDSWLYKSMVITVVAPPAIHIAAIYADTLFRLGWGIPAPPEPYASLGINIVLTFLGGNIGAGAVIGAAKFFMRGR